MGVNRTNAALRQFAQYVLVLTEDDERTGDPIADFNDLPRMYHDVGEEGEILSEHIDAFTNPLVITFINHMMQARLSYTKASSASPSTTEQRARHVTETMATLFRAGSDVQSTASVIESTFDIYNLS